MHVVCMVFGDSLHLLKMHPDNQLHQRVFGLSYCFVQHAALGVAAGERCFLPAGERPVGLSVGLVQRHHFPNGFGAKLR